MNLTLYIRRLDLIYANLTVHEFKPTSLNLYFTELYGVGVGRADMVLMIFEISVQYRKHLNYSTLNAEVRDYS